MKSAGKFLEYSLAIISSFIVVILFIVGFYYFNPPSSPTGPNQIVINNGDERGKVLACFDAKTKILVADGDSKNIEEVLPGEKVLTRESESSPKLVEAVVSKVEKHVVDQYVVINGDLKVTVEHIMFINREWKPVALAGHGDKLLTEGGKEMEVKSLSIRHGQFEVWNLKIDKYHTYIAGGFYAHD